MATLVVGSARGSLAELLANVWNIAFIGELSSAFLPAAVASSLEHGLIRRASQERQQKKLIEMLAKHGVGDPDKLVKQWLEAERDSKNFTI